MPEVANAKVLVVGASGGVGRAIGARLVAKGASVAFAARRFDAVKEAAAQAGGNAIGVECDVRDPASCDAAAAETVERLGGLTDLVYCAARGALRHLDDVDADLWRDILDTNVVGAALMTQSCLPHLVEARGHAVFFSSISASETRPWPGLGSYIVSKAALNKLIEALAMEHPEVRFTRLTMGDCAGGEGPEMTGFTQGWDDDLFGEMVGIWAGRGYMSGGLLDVQEVTDVIASIISTDAIMSTVVLRPAAPPPGAQLSFEMEQP